MTRSPAGSFTSLDQIDLNDIIQRPAHHKPVIDQSVFEKHEVPEAIPPSSSELPIKDWRLWYLYNLPINFYRKCFVSVSIVSALIVLALEIYITVIFFTNMILDTLRKKAIATYLVLFICAEIYQCVITIFAVVWKLRIQVFLLLTFIGCMVIYTGIQFAELKLNLTPDLPPEDRLKPKAIIITIICLEVATFLAQTYLFFVHLRNDFAWNVFKRIGAAPEALKRLSHFQKYTALLFFDAFFFPAFTLQFVIMMPKVEPVEFVLTIIVIPASIFLLICAFYFASNEIYWGSYSCIFVYFLGLVYAFFKVIRIYTHNTKQLKYYPGRKSLTLFAVFSIILLLLSIISGSIVISNFNKGLKKYVARTFFGKEKHVFGGDVDDEEKIEMESPMAYDSYKGNEQSHAVLID